MITFGSLFSGIGAFDLGFHNAGWDCLWQIEIDDFCREILDMRFPWTEKHGDIKDVDGTKLAMVDAIVGGFPCQPVSVAGRQAGERDSRWLWPDFFRIVGDIRPSYIIIENVRGLLLRGGARVLADLANAGYDAEWNLIPASALGADHKRERLFIVAYAKSIGMERVWPSGIEVPYALFEEILSVRDSNGQWKVEPDVRRTDDGLAPRVDRLKALGNAVVPQFGEWIGGLINASDVERRRRQHNSA